MSITRRTLGLRVSVLAAAAIGCALGGGLGSWLADNVVTAVSGGVDRSSRLGQAVLLATFLMGAYAGLKGWTVVARRLGASDEDIRHSLFDRW
jgi:hypothetical protein